MSGFITKTEVMADAAFIIETWGQNFYTACLDAEGETFLAMLVKYGKL